MNGKYLIWLKESVRKAQAAHESLWKLAQSERQIFKSPNLEREVESLLTRMQHPSKGVKVVDIDDYSGVDVREVVSRGIQRKRPADSEGEELRDVILWLLVVYLARKSGPGIVFISNDKTFAAENGRGLHPDLIADLISSKVHVDFYRSLREFVVAKALDHAPMDADHFYTLARLKEIEEMTTKLMLRYVTRVGSIRDVDLKEFEFERATRYKVGEDAYFIEASFGGAGSFLIGESVCYVGNVVSGDQTSQTLVTESAGYAFTAPQVPTLGYNQQFAWTSPTLFANNFGWGDVGAVTYIAPEPRKYLCSFTVSVSARAAAQRLESLEIDSIHFKSFLLDE